TLIALGEPGSVPAGPYAEEVFSSMGLLDTVKAKANYGSDVRTVLSWVKAGEVDCGVVYATDAYTTDRVKITDTAPEGSCRKVVYPAGVTASCRNKEKAGVFMDFLSSDEAKAVFASYGFTV
ncbi:MAG: molybdate ABC transporter substrate-binding protein, partial [Oscillospiraceae bacterium]|nr:molybdate ABC transporter substrate-binding protein [Oscillospiraceae bacterium]